MTKSQKLKKKLKEKKQQLIENVPCPRCGETIHYILTGHGSAIEGRFGYEEVEPDRISIIRQDGQYHRGYLSHECKEN